MYYLHHLTSTYFLTPLGMTAECPRMSNQSARHGSTSVPSWHSASWCLNPKWRTVCPLNSRCKFQQRNPELPRNRSLHPLPTLKFYAPKPHWSPTGSATGGCDAETEAAKFLSSWDQVLRQLNVMNNDDWQSLMMLNEDWWGWMMLNEDGWLMKFPQLRGQNLWEECGRMSMTLCNMAPFRDSKALSPTLMPFLPSCSSKLQKRHFNTHRAFPDEKALRCHHQFSLFFCWIQWTVLF